MYPYHLGITASERTISSACSGVTCGRCLPCDDNRLNAAARVRPRVDRDHGRRPVRQGFFIICSNMPSTSSYLSVTGLSLDARRNHSVGGGMMSRERGSSPRVYRRGSCRTCTSILWFGEVKLYISRDTLGQKGQTVRDKNRRSCRQQEILALVVLSTWGSS